MQFILFVGTINRCWIKLWPKQKWTQYFS